MSVFYYEIKSDIETACKIASAAFDEAVDGLDDIEDESYKDSTTIM